MIICRNPGSRAPRSLVQGRVNVGTVIRTERFTEKHAQHYIKLYRDKGGDEAKKWAREVLASEPRTAMVKKVNELLSKSLKRT